MGDTAGQQGGERSRGDRHRILTAIGVGTAVGLVLLGLGALLRVRDAERAAHPSHEGTVEVAGLGAALEIDRDRHGVPHVAASSESDAFYALGFCHAQDRLGQLLDLRSRARGTTAARVGSEAVDADRLARLVDFRGLAERQLPHLRKRTRALLRAYAAGVNAHIARVESGQTGLPPVLKGRNLEPWQPEDSLAVFKLFAWNLSNSLDTSLVLQELVEELGPLEAGRFFPPRAGGEPPSRRTAAVAPWVASGVRELRRAGGLDGFGVGSSAFVVGGALSESGHSVLVADSHFEPTVPAPLYLAHLRGDGFDVAGATVPGVPLFWWGRNDAIAWASVGVGAVVTDLYTETLRKELAEYHDGRRWREVTERWVKLDVDGDDPVSFIVRGTSRGPLLPSAEPASDEAIAVAWTGARIEGTSGIGSLLGVARARSETGVMRALRRHHEPPLALAWVDAEGGGGFQVAGWIPQRTLAAQLLPLPGRAPWYAWQEPLAFASLPSRNLDSGRDWLVAADQPFRASAAEDPVDATWRSGARAARFGALLGALDGPADLTRLAALQRDVVIERSRRLAQTALSLLDGGPRGEESVEAARMLDEWDARASRNSVGSAVYHVFLGSLAEALFAEQMGEDLFARYLALPDLDLEGLVESVLEDAVRGGVGDSWSEPESVTRAVATALRETWLDLSFRHGADPRVWRWGEMHPVVFRSTSGASEDLGPFPYGGAPHAVLAGGYSAADPFGVQVAATARFAVDASALDVALTALAPGQSEHPGHPYYDEGLAGWLEGRYALLATRRLEVEELSVARMRLEPAP